MLERLLLLTTFLILVIILLLLFQMLKITRKTLQSNALWLKVTGKNPERGKKECILEIFNQNQDLNPYCENIVKTIKFVKSRKNPNAFTGISKVYLKNDEWAEKFTKPQNKRFIKWKNAYVSDEPTGEKIESSDKVILNRVIDQKFISMIGAHNLTTEQIFYSQQFPGLEKVIKHKDGRLRDENGRIKEQEEFNTEDKFIRENWINSKILKTNKNGVYRKFTLKFEDHIAAEEAVEKKKQNDWPRQIDGNWFYLDYMDVRKDAPQMVKKLPYKMEKQFVERRIKATDFGGAYGKNFRGSD